MRALTKKKNRIVDAWKSISQGEILGAWNSQPDSNLPY
jgi:hypothetical protein